MAATVPLFLRLRENARKTEFGRFLSKPVILIILLSSLVFGFTAIAHENNLAASASILAGNSASRYSFIIGLTLGGLGFGGLIQARFGNERLVDQFLNAEILLTLVSGFSGILAFLAYSRLPFDYVLAIYLLAFLISTLVGIEDAVLLRIAALDGNDLKYAIGLTLFMAHAGGMAAGFFYGTRILPQHGPISAALLLGLADAAIVLVNVVFFWRHLSLRFLKFAVLAATAAGLVVAQAKAAPIHRYLNQTLYEEQIVAEWSNEYGAKTLTCWRDDCYFYINGSLQFATKDEHIYHELLVAPAMNLAEARANRPLNVLVAGGGDGLAVREVLKYDVATVTVVDLDPQMTGEVASANAIARYNQRAFDDPRVEIIVADAFSWMMQNSKGWMAERGLAYYDVVVFDLVDPNLEAAKLYNVEVYKRCFGERPGEGLLGAGGIVVTQSVSPWHTPRTFWTIHNTLRAAAPYVTPYRYAIPSFGDWGFNIASDRPFAPEELVIAKEKNRWLNRELWLASLAFSTEERRLGETLWRNGEISSIGNPRVLIYLKEETEWN
jgi:spermidine synthase